MRSVFLTIFAPVKESTLGFLGIVLGISLFSCSPSIKSSSRPIGTIRFSDLSLSSLVASDTTVGLTGMFSASIQNTSSASIDLGSVLFTSTGTVNGTEFAITGGTCVFPGSISGGSSCTVSGTFVPGGAGARSEQISINYVSGALLKSENATLSGLALTPGALSISSISFTSTTVGASSTAVTATVTNTGESSVVLTSRSLRTTGILTGTDYAITGGTCSDGGVITPTGTCTLLLVFSPTTAGSRSDTIDVLYNDSVNAQTESLGISTTGLTPASLSLSAVTFPDTFTTASSAAQTMTVTNSGGSIATLTSRSADPIFFNSGGTCAVPGSLGAGASCTILITLIAPSRGANNLIYQLNYNDGSQAQTASRSMSAIGLLPATLNGVGIDFGSTISGVATIGFTLSVTNTGDVSATSVNGLVPTHFGYLGGTYPGTGGNCGTSLSPGASCDIKLVFLPASAYGYIGGVYEIDYESGAGLSTFQTILKGLSHTLLVSGVPKANAPSNAAAAWDFGPVRVGGEGWYVWTLINRSSTAVPFALSNVGGNVNFSFGTADAIGSSPDLVNDPGYKQDCTSPLAPGTSCDLLVKYQPTSASGLETGILRATVGDSAQDLTLNGSGETPLSCSCPPGNNFESFTSGNSEADAYRICSVQHLQRMHAIFDSQGGFAGKYFRQCSEISASSLTSSIGAGTATTSFSGIYDGNDFIVRDMNLTKSVYNCSNATFWTTVRGQECTGISTLLYENSGLFAALTTGAVIKNLGLKRNRVGGETDSGVLAGNAGGTLPGAPVTISYVWTSGSILTYTVAYQGFPDTYEFGVTPSVWGGLIGDARRVNLDHVFSLSDFSPTDGSASGMPANTTIGGVVGMADETKITDSFFGGTIEIRTGTPAKWAGGIVGAFTNTIATQTMERLYNVASRITIGEVGSDSPSSLASGLTGGIAGYHRTSIPSTNSMMDLANFTGVSSYGTVGGIFGWAEWYFDSYPTRLTNYGSIAGQGSIGGIFGYSSFNSMTSSAPFEKIRNDGDLYGGSLAPPADSSLGGLFGTLAILDSDVALNNLSHFGSVGGDRVGSRVTGALLGRGIIDAGGASISNSLTIATTLDGGGEGGWLGIVTDSGGNLGNRVSSNQSNNFFLPFRLQSYSSNSGDICSGTIFRGDLVYLDDSLLGDPTYTGSRGLVLGGLDQRLNGLAGPGCSSRWSGVDFEDPSAVGFDPTMYPWSFPGIWFQIQDLIYDP